MLILIPNIDFGDEPREYDHPQLFSVTSSRIYLQILSELYGYTNDAANKKLESQSRLHPGCKNLARMLANYGEEASRILLLKIGKFEENSREVAILRRDMYKRWRDMQTSLMSGTLVQEGRIALLLKQRDADVVAMKLTRSNRKFVYIGREALQNTTIEFRIEGYLPAFVRRGIGGVEKAGIWIHWDGLVQAGSNMNTWRMSTLDLSASNMNGHILAIFFVLMVGILLGSCFFGLEFTGGT